MNYKKYFLISLIAALGLSALVGIYIFLFGDAEETEMRILTTTLAIGVFSLLGLSCATLQNREGLRWLSITGVIIPIIAFIITVYGIRSDSEIKDLWKAAGIATTLAVGLAHVSLLLLIDPLTAQHEAERGGQAEGHLRTDGKLLPWYQQRHRPLELLPQIPFAYQWRDRNTRGGNPAK